MAELFRPPVTLVHCPLAVLPTPPPMLAQLADEVAPALEVAVRLHIGQRDQELVQELVREEMHRAMTPAEEHSRQELASLFGDLAGLLMELAQGEPVLN